MQFNNDWTVSNPEQSEVYWRCCDEEEVEFVSLDSARNSLEEHERIQHKSKSVGSFGAYRKLTKEI
jgi:hypothetical protein